MVSVEVEPTTATYSCPKKCSMTITCPVRVWFTVTKKDKVQDLLEGHATIDLQPVWDHVLFWHGADDPGDVCSDCGRKYSDHTGGDPCLAIQ